MEDLRYTLLDTTHPAVCSFKRATSALAHTRSLIFCQQPRQSRGHLYLLSGPIISRPPIIGRILLSFLRRIPAQVQVFSKKSTFRIRCYSTVLTVSLLSTIYKIFQDEDSISGSENFNLRNSREKNSPFLVRNGTISRHIRDIKIENNTCLVEATRVKAG